MTVPSLHDMAYGVPLVPVVARAVVVARFRQQMAEIPSESEQDREGHRSLIVVFAGFSFTGVVALVVLEATVKQSLRGAVFFLLVSFLTYLWALNLQGYKAFRWQGEAATALSESGALCLVSALVSLLTSSQLGRPFVVVTSLLAGCVWLIDQLLRLIFDWMYLSTRESMQKQKETTRAGQEKVI